MQTVAGSIVGQAYGTSSLSSYSTKNAAFGGYTGGKYYVYVLKFTIPNFNGLSKTMNFDMYINNQSGQKTANLRYAICDSDENAKNYMGTASGVSDPHQKASGVISIQDLSGTTKKHTIEINTTNLKTGGTYYLFLWSYDNTNFSCVATSSTWGEFAVSLTYVEKYKLYVNVGNGSTISVNRKSSPSGSVGIISNGADIYNGDVISVTFGAMPGYNLTSHTVNGSTFTSGSQLTVSRDVVIVSSASLKFYKLKISPGTGSTITVKRNGKILANGASIYHGDVLLIEFSSSSIYEILTQKVNGIDFKSGSKHTVSGNVTVTTTTRILGFVYLTINGKVKKFRVIVFHYGKWRKYRPIIIHKNSDISATGVGDSIVISTNLPVSLNKDTVIIGGS